MKNKLASLLILGLGFALPAAAQVSVEELRTECYDVYKPQYDQALATAPGIVSTNIDWDGMQEQIPGGIAEMFGITTEQVADLEAMMDQTTSSLAPLTKDAYLAIAQIRIDLAQCYVDHGADAADTLAEAQDIYDRTAAYDFDAAFKKDSTGTSLVEVPAGGTRQLRLRSFCLDGGRGVPANGEEYYLAGNVSDLQSDSLCAVMRSANSGSAASTVQTEIWTEHDTTPRPSSEIAAENAAETPGISDDVDAIIKAGPEGMVFKAVNAVPNMVGMGMAIGGGVLVLAGIVCGAAKWLPKPVWISGIVVGAGLAAVGIATVAAKTTAAQEAASLFDASQSGQVIVTARSSGSFSSIDVVVQNLSNEPLTLDTSCLNFIPKTSAANAGYNYNFDFDFGDDFNYNPDTPDNYGDSNVDQDSAEYSQRLGTGEIIDDDPPPFPWWPPIFEPEEEELDIEKLQEKVRKALDEAIKKLQENPTEDNLEEVMKERARCEATGCNEESDPQDKKWDEIQEAWQKAVDKAVQDYKDNPSDLNREELERAAELGQLIGADTDAAVEILQNNPQPDLVG